MKYYLETKEKGFSIQLFLAEERELAEARSTPPQPWRLKEMEERERMDICSDAIIALRLGRFSYFPPRHSFPPSSPLPLRRPSIRRGFLQLIIKVARLALLHLLITRQFGFLLHPSIADALPSTSSSSKEEGLRVADVGTGTGYVFLHPGFFLFFLSPSHHWIGSFEAKAEEKKNRATDIKGAGSGSGS